MSKPEPAPGEDPRVDLRKDAAEPPTAAPEPPTAAPAPEPAAAPEPVDPWAPPAGHPPQAAPLTSQAPPPPPPPPLPAGGWATVPPSARSGLQPGQANQHQQQQYPYPYGYPTPYNPQPEPSTNGFAVGSLVTGLFLLGPVALVLGILALNRIGRRGERGQGMAVTGVVLGVAGTVLLALALGAGDFGPANNGRYGQAGKPPAGSVRWSALKAGDCYNSPDGGSVTDENGDETVFWVRRVPCADPHHGEVAGTAKVPDGSGSYPGESAVREQAVELCRTVLDDYALDQWAVPDGMSDVYLYPSEGNWESGERLVTCGFEDRDDQHRGTVRTDRAGLTSAQLAYLEAVRGFNSTYADAPAKDLDEAGPDYQAWARRMAAASRAEAAALRRPTVDWPAEARSDVGKLAEAQSQAAAAWDTAASGTDLAGDLRRARALVAKTVPISVEIRRALGLSTGEQAPDLRV
ncbi:DUF4190 domain-containing protein [Kitasatospora sp. SUK 42]|uniref:DUF4190 domain-containing protein n=1 Tax=Kitasatospora sp. SUK 42 TaxID=1588882 RepID=UPI001C31AC39|nr:DUF4190 domain-containing protein [Kitasatospora sp. SUK 42]MBV2152198.1 DUF4190 domain-containing protein [Kitasatospora sp. SUK 42]